MSSKTPEELASEASAPGTFSFAERLRGRAYAKDDVKINLNEELGYKLNELEIDLDNAAAGEVADIEKKISALKDQLKASEYTVHMQGISSEAHDSLVDFAQEQYPYEYDESVSPLSGAKSKSIVQNDDRDKLFMTKLWIANIVSIESSDGSIDDNIDESLINDIRNAAPLAAVARISDTVNKLRLATDWIEYTEDEDFLAKP